MSLAPSGSRYVDQRPYVVPESLDELRGQRTGTVRVEKRLIWSGRSDFDLANPRHTATLYETVLREASSVSDLVNWINRETLMDRWAALTLPPRLTDLWEARFPELARARRRTA